jgi:hypothetical protein
VAGDALQFSNQQADVLRPTWRLNAHQLLDGPRIRYFVEYGREVVDIVQIADAPHHRAILQGLFDAPVEVADDRCAIQYGLS